MILNVVPQGERFVVERLGKLLEIKESGWFLGRPATFGIQNLILRLCCLESSGFFIADRASGSEAFHYGGTDVNFPSARLEPVLSASKSMQTSSSIQLCVSVPLSASHSVHRPHRLPYRHEGASHGHRPAVRHHQGQRQRRRVGHPVHSGVTPLHRILCRSSV